MSSTEAKPAPVEQTDKKARRPQGNKSASRKDDKPAASKRYQPKLNLEEDVENKTSLVKITRNSGVRQIINFALPKIWSEWKVEFNAFSLDVQKALHAAEIIKTRCPYLHQETKIIVSTKSIQQDDKEKSRTFTGISVTLSRNSFQVSDQAGYQKPKPRTFVQPMGRKKEEEKVPEPPKEEPKKQRRDRKRKDKRSESHSEEEKRKKSAPPKDEEQKPKKQRRGKGKKNEFLRSQSHSEEDRYPQGPPRERRPPSYYERDHARHWDERNAPPRYAPRPGSYDRDRGYGYYGPPRGHPNYRGMRGGGNFGRPQFDGGHGGRRGPQDRPGYFAAHRDFKMDRRDQPLESLHTRANDHIERERQERQRTMQHREGTRSRGKM